MHMLKMLNMYQVLICTYRVGDHSFLTFGWRVESHCIKLYDGNIHTYIHTMVDIFPLWTGECCTEGGYKVYCIPMVWYIYHA